MHPLLLCLAGEGYYRGISSQYFRMKNFGYLLLAVLIALGGWFYFNSKSTPPSSSNVAGDATASAVGAGAQAGDTATAGVPNAVGNTNPFESNTNPVSGYQNPFGN